MYAADGTVLQGMNGSTGEDRRAEVVVVYAAKGGEQVRLWVEVACNGLFGCSEWEVGPTPPDVNKQCPLKQVELGLFDREAWALMYDFTIIADMAEVC